MNRRGEILPIRLIAADALFSPAARLRGKSSSLHRWYLAAGGIGFTVADVRLNYCEETVTEVYYRFQIGKHVQLSPDYQYYVNPGYNRDRAPAQVVSLRLPVNDQ